MRWMLDQEERDTHLLLTPAVSQIRKGRPTPPFFFPEVVLSQANWLVIGTLIERDFFLELGGFENLPHGLEDWSLWSRAYKEGARVVRVKSAVYRAWKNAQSKHHLLMRRPEHVYWHQKVGHSIWPDRFDAPTSDEDERKQLRNNALRMMNQPVIARAQRPRRERRAT